MSILRTVALTLGLAFVANTALAGGMMQYKTLVNKGQAKETLPGGGRDFLVKVGQGRPGVQLKHWNYQTKHWNTYVATTRASQKGNLIVHLDSGKYKDLSSGKLFFLQPIPAR